MDSPNPRAGDEELEQQKLQDLLQKLQSKEGIQLTPSSLESHLSLLLSAFLPTASPRVRSLGFLVLTRLVFNAQPNPSQEPSPEAREKAKENLVRLFTPSILSRLSSTEAPQVLSGLGLLTALFQVDSPTASDIFLRDGIIETILEAPDIFQDHTSLQVKRATASLLSQASGSKTCRPVVATYATEWLNDCSHQQKDSALRAAAAIALTKLSRGAGEDANAAPGGGIPGSDRKENAQARASGEEKLADLMKSVVLNEAGGESKPELSGVVDAIEGLAYLSVEPAIKETLSNDATFLSRLFALVPKPRKHQTGPVPVIKDDLSTLSPSEKDSLALLYGIAVIISNIVEFRPQMSEEDAQIERLRKMAKESVATGGKLQEPKKVDPATDLEEDLAVKKRCARLLKAGVLVPLVAMASRVESEGLRAAVGKALLSLVEEKANRGKVVQAGGVKALSGIIRTSIDGLKKSSQPQRSPSRSKHPPQKLTLEPSDLLPIQALAKISITSSPLLVFGPDASSSIDAIGPFSHLLLNSASNLLQRFEALMALTNIASLGPEIAARVAKKDLGILPKSESLLLDDNVMVRRAATELICNLISTDEVWEKYTGESGAPDSTPREIGTNQVQVLLALSDVDDLPTRLAASGALAMLTSSKNFCRTALWKMENGVHRVFAVFTELLVPSPPDGDGSDDEGEAPTSQEQPRILDPQLALRGVTCVWNIFKNVSDPSGSQSGEDKRLVDEAQESGMVIALMTVLTSPAVAGSRETLMPCAQSLRWLADHGAMLPGATA